MPNARRISAPLLLAGAVACCGFITGPASASSSTAAATSYGVAPSHVMLNPQPLPPRLSWSGATSLTLPKTPAKAPF